jgi:hypothetical protein
MQLICLTTAARAYIKTSCGKDDDDDEPASESSSSSSTVYPSSAPYHGPGPTSPGTGASSSIPFHWPFSSDSTGPALTNTADTADATGTVIPSTTGGATTLTFRLPPASTTASGNDSSAGNSTASSQNGTQTSVSSPDSQNATGVLTLTLTGTPTASATSPPPYTGLAAHFDGGAQLGIALGLVGAGFAMFL